MDLYYNPHTFQNEDTNVNNAVCKFRVEAELIRYISIVALVNLQVKWLTYYFWGKWNIVYMMYRAVFIYLYLFINSNS